MYQPQWPPPNSTPEVEKRHRESIRETFFQELVARKILERFGDELSEAGMTEREIQEASEAFGALTEMEKRSALAIPAKLQRTMFENYVKKMRAGSITPAGMVAEILRVNQENKFTIGYHLTQSDVPEGKDDWMIVGKEKDHRHNDLPMAYYSLDYAHRYIRKPSRFLYVVRVDQKPDSGHYPDNDGTWGHAPTLSIIDKVDMLEIEHQLDERMSQLREKKS